MEIRFSPRHLKRMRAEQGMTQTEVANRVGVTLGTYWKYENGMSIPSIEALPMFTGAFHCDVWDLFEGVR